MNRWECAVLNYEFWWLVVHQTGRWIWPTPPPSTITVHIFLSTSWLWTTFDSNNAPMSDHLSLSLRFLCWPCWLLQTILFTTLAHTIRYVSLLDKFLYAKSHPIYTSFINCMRLLLIWHIWEKSSKVISLSWKMNYLLSVQYFRVRLGTSIIRAKYLQPKNSYILPIYQFTPVN